MSVPDGANYLRKALHPVFIFAAICGVQMFEYRVVFLNYLQYIVMWSTYTLIFWLLWFWSDFGLIFYDYMYRFVLFANSITSLMATALTLQHKKKFQRILESLTIINNTFGVLNIPNECKKLERLTWTVLGLWCMTVLYFIITDASWMTVAFGRMIGVLVVLIIDTPYLINVITYIIICLVLSYTESRFELLNKHIEKLTDQKGRKTCWNFKSYGVTGRLNPMNISKRNEDIWTLMHIHAELRRICRDLNTIFGMQITFEIASYFIYLCAVAVFFCQMYSLPLTAHLPLEVYIRLGMVVAWASVYTARLIYFNHICEAACAQARKTEKLMYAFLNCIKDFQLQEEMRQFILYMISRPLRFCGAGLFYFGYQFIHMFFGSILTVVVIIIQMRNTNGRNTLKSYIIADNVTSNSEILSNNVTVNSSYLGV